MHNTIALISFALLLTISIAINNMQCLNSNQKFPSNFHLLKRCKRSVQPVIGLSNTKYRNECEQFTKSNKGLAFNFGSTERWSRVIFPINTKSGNEKLFPRNAARRPILEQPEEFYNCHALACPEIRNSTTLVADSRFDYFTLYANPVPPSDSTCIPEVGIFQFYSALTNYSSASKTCQSNGALAHILSENRTNRLSRFLRTKANRIAYVGLNSNLSGTEFYTAEKESLECFLFRAWAPGHPSDHLNQSCVAITMENSWITIDCTRKLPFICEIYSTGQSDEKIEDYC